jgi:MFS family permease
MGIVAGTTLLGEHSPAVLAATLTVVGVLAAAGFVVVERRARHPLVAAAARRSPALRWGAFGSFVNNAATSSSMTVATLHLQGPLGLAPHRAGALLGSFSVLVVVGAIGAPRLITALGWGRALGCGLGVVAAGSAVLVAWPHVVGVGVAAGVSGLGIGIGSVAATDLGTSVDEAIKATAAGVLNTAAQLGTAIGTSLILLVATTFHARPAWAVAACLAAGAALGVARRAPSTRSAPPLPAGHRAGGP